MSYQVFARKYRPQTFDDLVGQGHVTRTLKNAVAQNRLAHAYLFVGPRGIGKTSTARILAKALNCINGPTISPCGVCDNCKEITAGNSLDVLEIDGASNNGVEQVRELRDNVRYAPANARFKIYIIDEVHMLTSAAFNALLKTLEEPPPHVKFIFATTEPQKVLPTILSRCQRFDLHRIPANLIAQHLQFIAGHEKITLEPAAAHAIARGADGGLRDAESMLDQLVAFCGEGIAEADVLNVFGFTSEETVASLTGAILRGATSEALDLLHEQAELGKDMMKLMTDLISHLRDLLVFKVKPDAVADDYDECLQAAQKAEADLVPTVRLLELIEQFAATEGRMKWAPNKKLHFEVALIKAVTTLSQATLTEVIENLTALRDGGIPPAARRIEPEGCAGSKTPAGIASERSFGKKAPQEGVIIASRTANKVQAGVPEPSRTADKVASGVAEASPKASQIPSGTPGASPTSGQVSFADPEASRNPDKRPGDDPGASAKAATISDGDRKTAEAPGANRAASSNQTAMTGLAGAELWQRMLEEIRQRRPLMRTWAETAVPIDSPPRLLHLGFAPENRHDMDSLLRPNYKSFLQALASEMAGADITLKLTIQEGLVAPALVQETPPEPIAELTPAAPPADPMEAFKNDPLIREALEIFKGEINPVTK